VDETLIKVGSEYIWLWAAIETKDRHILALDISKERNMFVAERFFAGLVKTRKTYGINRHEIWYPQACRFLKVGHHLQSPFEKSIIERTMQYLKDRTEGSDDYFPCKKKEIQTKACHELVASFCRLP
jgi:putative transposase